MDKENKEHKVYEFLKNYISKNGFERLFSDPFSVYKSIINAEIPPRSARLILVTLLSGTVDLARKNCTVDTLTSHIQKENCLTKKVACKLAELYILLFNEENEREWDDNKFKGFHEFCSNEWTIEWDGRCEWRTKHRSAYPCSAEARIVFAVDNADLLHKHLNKELSKNPFLTADDVYGILLKQLSDDLDNDLNDYCNADDYYEPYLEEFVGEGTYESQQKWESWGLEIKSFEGSGDVDFEM